MNTANLTAIAILLLGFSSYSPAADTSLRVETLVENETEQSLLVSFWLEVDPDCALDALFDHTYITRVSDKVDRVELVSSSNTGQVIQYHYDGFFLTMTRAISAGWNGTGARFSIDS